MNEEKSNNKKNKELNDLKSYISLNLKEKYKKILKEYHREPRKFLRHNRIIEFIDYNTIKIKKTYYLEIDPSKLKSNFITIRETHNSNKAHTHIISIFFDNMLV